MKSKLIKASVRKSGARVYVGRVFMVRNYEESFPASKVFSFSNGCAPAQIANRQRYMRIERL